MDGVLERATVLSVCKLACSLPFVPSLNTSSPMSFCCCCLLIFTDVVLTVFLSVLLVLKRWQTELTSADDAVPLRCLLFICHTYGAVFLLTLPAIILDTLIRLLQHQDSNCHHAEKLKDDKSADEGGGGGEEESALGYHVVGYLCCLSLWVFGTLSIGWRWEQEEEWTVVRLHSTNSLLTSLPNIYMLRFLPPCWVMALLYLTLAFILSFSFGLLQRKPTITQLASPDVDPGKAENRCKVQVSYLKDFERLSPGSLKSENSGKDYNGIEKVIPLTLSIKRQLVGPQSGCGRAFPCPGADVMMGVACALAIFVLPLNLSVNIHLISSIDKALELGVKYFCLSKSVTAYNGIYMV